MGLVRPLLVNSLPPPKTPLSSCCGNTRGFATEPPSRNNSSNPSDRVAFGQWRRSSRSSEAQAPQKPCSIRSLLLRRFAFPELYGLERGHLRAASLPRAALKRSLLATPDWRLIRDRGPYAEGKRIPTTSSTTTQASWSRRRR